MNSLPEWIEQDKKRYFAYANIENDIRRINQVLEVDIFNEHKEKHPLRQAAFTEIIVCLNDLLQKAKDFDVPVTFDDDVPTDIKGRNDNSPDITDFVSVIRNIACHIESGGAYVLNEGPTAIHSAFAVVFDSGYTLWDLPNQGIKIGPKYADDFCFNIGRYLIYYNRQILRAFNEVQANLKPIIDKYDDPDAYAVVV